MDWSENDQPLVVAISEDLQARVEALSTASGRVAHLDANLIGAYRSAIAEVSRTGDHDFGEIPKKPREHCGCC